MSIRLTLSPPKGVDQSKLTALLKTDSIDNFLESLTEYDLARITSAGAAGASSWLTSPPDYNQPLSSEQFQSAVLWEAPRLASARSPPTESIGARRENDIPYLVDREGVHFSNLSCGSANSARFNMESHTGEWRTIRHDAIARVMTDFVVEAGFRTKW